MNAATLLCELRQRDVSLLANADALEIEAPPGVLQPRVLDAIRDHKAELLALLQTDRLASAPSTLQASIECDTKVHLNSGVLFEPGAAPDVSEASAFEALAFARARRRERLETARRGVYASELYDPQAAREYARSEGSLTPEQWANLLTYADAFEAHEREAVTADDSH